MNQKRKKKGISELVSYILLITLTIAIAAGTYAWLRSIAVPPQNVECPDEMSGQISLWIINDTCHGQDLNSDGSPKMDEPGTLTFFLENKGKIDINGFRIQVSDKTIDPVFSDITIHSSSSCSLGPTTNTYSCRINASDIAEVQGAHRIHTVELIRITPMKRIDNKDAYCKSIDFQIDDCVEGIGGPES